MSKKKGLSLEDKRTRLLELFHEKKEPFLLKELEKIAPKEKGITMQSVKEVVTSLVGDDLVETDKIGTSVYFWSFPSKSFTVKSNKLKQIEQTLNDLKEKDKKLDSDIEIQQQNSKESKEDSKRRMEINEELTELKSKRIKLESDIDQFKDCDSSEKLQEECTIAREAIERWTDNVFAVRSWAKNKFNMDNAEVNKALNIPANFDYYEESN